MVELLVMVRAVVRGTVMVVRGRAAVILRVVIRVRVKVMLAVLAMAVWHMVRSSMMIGTISTLRRMSLAP